MKKLLLTFLIVMSMAPAFAYAQATPTQFCNNGICTYTPLEPLPGQPANGQALTFAQYVGNIFTISIVIGGMIAVVVLVFSGITYMVSEALPQKDWGKRKMRQALWALLILLGSYLILSTINPNLVNLGGFLTSPTNPLSPVPFIQQTNQGTAANNSATLPSGTQLQQQSQCTGNNYWSGTQCIPYNANGI